MKAGSALQLWTGLMRLRKPKAREDRILEILEISGIGSEIVKSINERSKLSAQVFNTLVDFKYLKSPVRPKEAYKLARIRVMNGVSEYKKLRACFNNYQDPKTLKNDEQIQAIVDSLNRQEIKP